MRPTSIRLLTIVIVVGAALGWAVTVVVQGWTGRSVPVPLLAGSSLWLLGIALGIWGLVIRPRLQARIDPRAHPGVLPLPVLVAARVAAIAMAASRVGAAVAGFYAGVAIATVTDGLTSPAATRSLWSALLAASGGAVTCLAAVRLERACLLPSGADDEDR